MADKRIAAAGFTKNIEVLLCDHRALPIPREKLLEAVGREFLTTYFACIGGWLRREGGIVVCQCIAMPEIRYEGYAKGENFFPRGHLPTVTQLVESINKGSQGRLIVDQIENIGPHYSKTLRLWKEKFMMNFDARIQPTLVSKHSSMTESE